MLLQMQKSSSSSVKAFWLDRDEAVRRIRDAVEVLTAEHPKIERAVLFGSLARGDAVPGSDADLMLVLRECALPWKDRSAHFKFGNVGIPVDLFAYTRSELNQMRESGNAFIARILQEGIDLL